MRLLYNILTYCSIAFLEIAKLWSPKLRLFVNGRKETFNILKTTINKSDHVVWFHCASLGEYEQGVPIIEAIKSQYIDYKVIVTFFSPSGYENKKNSPLADAIVYLPMDTKKNARRFIKAVRPSLAIFVKYEFWPNYLFELQKNNIASLLVSGAFRSDQIFFKPYGSFMRSALQTFDHHFVQNTTSKNLLEQIKIKNCTVSGDTRFDRVSHQIEQDNKLAFIEEFTNDDLCIVAGSTWPEDETVLLESINSAAITTKFIIAPHQIDSKAIEGFRKKLKNPSVLYSEREGKSLGEFSVLIIDMIGLLTKIYSYADIAYVGGAMGKTGLHNILEPATFGVPIIIGQNYDDFPEAKRLRSLAGLFSISSEEECTALIERLSTDAPFRNKTGMIAGHFVNQNTGATASIMQYIQEKKLLN